jgi:7-keto-8-aminopelargonate synthetase-like enzyme
MDELEARLAELYRARSMVTLSASAASAGILPLIASGHLTDGKPRVMVFDKAAHFSMNLIKPICADEAPVLTAPHNDLNFLEDVCKKHQRVAYVADGFYSMGGATLVKELVELQDRYGLFLYFDDSHGLSIYGERGEGFVRALLGPELNPLTVVIASMAKAFGSTGGVVMLGPKQKEDIVARFGGPLGWSQNISPPIIGASLASARLHASPELHQLQQKLRANIRLFDELVTTPHRGEHFPIKVIEIGEEAQAVQRSRQMLERGFYTSAVFFPIVPRGKAGLRIMLRADLAREDIVRLGTAVRDIVGQK